MSLPDELGFRNPIRNFPHATMLNIYYTAQCMKKKAEEFFRKHDITDVQFNVLMLLKHQSGDEGGISQAKLSEMMLVNRSNITSLIDRMEKGDLVVRTATTDRRFNIIQLTEKGRQVLNEVEPKYIEEIQRLVVLSESEQQSRSGLLEKLRTSLKS